MLNKSKLNLSIVLLVVGIGLIPTGLFINGYLTDEVSSNVSNVLETIKEEAVSEIEESYLGLGIPEVLPELFDDLIPEIQTEIVYPIGIPKTLLYIKDKMLNKLPEFLNGSIGASSVYDTIDNVITINETSTTKAENEFFNNHTFQNDYDVDIKGVSEFIGSTNLSYSPEARHRLLNGHIYNNTNYAGIFSAMNLGRGIFAWLNFYSYAEADNGDNRTLIQTVYNCTWSSNQLQYFSSYIKWYLFEVIVVNYYTTLGYATIEDYANEVFYYQWANGTLASGGISLHQITDDFTETIRGLELGTPIPSNISIDVSKDLWNSSTNTSFVNADGIKKWFHAHQGDNVTEAELRNVYELTNSSYDLLVSWLTGTVKDKLVPTIFSLPYPVGFGITPTEYTIDLILDQWANATTFEDGINLGYGLKGFEVGIPIKTNITLVSAKSLFNTSTITSFIHRDGILDWIEAYEGNTDTRNEILSIFNLDLAQFNIVTDWLFTTFRYELVPAITWNLTQTFMVTHADNEFYRQWSDGKLFEEGILLGPILGLDSISGWELGIPTDSNIAESISVNLWSENDEYSLINFKGISLWFRAMKDSSYYNLLENYFGLNDTQMDAILDWLIKIREDYTLEISQIEANLPVNHYILGDNMFLALLITGGVLTGLGVIGIILQLVLKRK